MRRLEDGTTRRVGIGSRLAIIGVLVAALLVVTPTAAYATATCGGVAGVHEYSQQYIPSGTWNGEYGNYFTYNPTVQNIAQDFTLSHLYVEACYACIPFVEVGWYKGQGTSQQYDVSTPHYYTVWGSKYSSYNEIDSTSYPTQESTRLYELLYAGEDYTTGKAIWNYYWNTLSSPAYSVQVTGLFGGQPLAGGEVASNVGDPVQVSVQGQPNFQLLSQGGYWNDWTTAIATNTCADPGLGLTEDSRYQHFFASGYL